MKLVALNIVGGDYFYDPFFNLLSIGCALALLSFSILLIIITKKPLNESRTNLELKQYTFGFESFEFSSKKVSLSTKIVACIISSFLILIPLEDLIIATNYYETVFSNIL